LTVGQFIMTLGRLDVDDVRLQRARVAAEQRVG
jgi:hypothetical protein